MTTNSSATVTAPAPLDRATARETSTRLATVGRHPVTGREDVLYFTSPAELERHLGQRDNRATNTVFELDTIFGAWIPRSPMTPTAAAEVARLGLYRPEPCMMCGGLFEITTMTEIKRPRARKIDGNACGTCAPECQKIATR